MDSAFGPVDGADADLGRPVLAPGEDISVGALVRSRVGDGVVDRLVDPLLGGVYAGRADDLSLAVTMPGLAQASREQNTLRLSVRAALARRAPTAGPVFATIEGGLTRLVDAMVAAMPSVDVRLGLPVRSIVETGAGTWRLTFGSTTEPETVEADAVVLALPSHPAARLLRGIDDEAAALVDTLDYASIGLVTHVFPAGTLDHTGLADRSGALIPAVEGRLVKAITVFSTKWGEQPDGAVLLRSSVGRYRDEAALQRSDAELATLTYDDLAKIVGVPLVAPLASTVTRWGGALPQYAPGHADRIARARASLPPTIALAGAVADGVGIPVCIRSGETAAIRVIQALGE